MLPKNVDMALVREVQAKGFTHEQVRDFANTSRGVGRLFREMHEETIAGGFYLTASRYKRVAQYLERGGV